MLNIKAITIISTCLVLCLASAAQHVGVGVSTTLGMLHIKGTHDSAQLVVQAFNNQSPQKPLMNLIAPGGTPLLSLQAFNENVWVGKNIGQVTTTGYKNIFIGTNIDIQPTTTAPYQNVFIGENAGRQVGPGSESIGIGKDVFTQQYNPVNLVGIGHLAANILYPDVVNTVAIGYKALNSSFGARSNNIAIGFLSQAKTVGSSNSVAIGDGSLYGSSVPGEGNTGNQNTGIGVSTLYDTRSGGFNTAVGGSSMSRNYNGQYNAAFGALAFISSSQANNSNDNVALGYASLYTASYNGKNTAIGTQALYTVLAGTNNIGIGYHAAYNIQGGSNNIAIGHVALGLTANAGNNTAIGYLAADNYNNGANNVFVGANTDVNGAGYYNVIALGQGTIVLGSNIARFGNSATGSYGGWANWTNVSDGRFKTAVQENVPGLAFIIKLRPVTYQLQARALDVFLQEQANKDISPEAKASITKAMAEKETITYTGFIAQEVEAAATSTGFNFSGVDAPKSDKEVNGLRYEEFVVPLVKAIQEQQQMLHAQDQKLGSIESDIQEINRKLTQAKKPFGNQR